MSGTPAVYLGDECQQAFQLLREVTGHDGRISIERAYIEAMGGDLLGGLFVSQIIFWSKHTKDPNGWFYRSADDWREKDYLTRYQVDKYTSICVEAGWLETRNKKAKGAPTRHYRVDGRAFLNWLNQQIGPSDLPKSANHGFAEISKTIDLPKSANDIHTPNTYIDQQTSDEAAPPPPQPVLEKAEPAPVQKPSKPPMNGIGHRRPNAAADPAVGVYVDIWGRYPSKPQMRLIADTVTDLDRWKAAVSAWMARGYRPTNVDGMLEWYRDPSRYADRYAPPAPVQSPSHLSFSVESLL